ncbi:hypothetical protein TNCT_535121 [Trichonephila clavata]|uniref:Uncharacterized protein n=1 Tax=Trichonephila clavata TaxID=2740835 RepID=A0A8X6LJH8_TRICU|nr:hypothetical protein TNCT_535121 [Trichonephila clavata]
MAQYWRQKSTLSPSPAYSEWATLKLARHRIDITKGKKSKKGDERRSWSFETNVISLQDSKKGQTTLRIQVLIPFFQLSYSNLLSAAGSKDLVSYSIFILFSFSSNMSENFLAIGHNRIDRFRIAFHWRNISPAVAILFPKFSKDRKKRRLKILKP